MTACGGISRRSVLIMDHESTYRHSNCRALFQAAHFRVTRLLLWRCLRILRRQQRLGDPNSDPVREIIWHRTNSRCGMDGETQQLIVFRKTWQQFLTASAVVNERAVAVVVGLEIRRKVWIL